MLEEKLVDHGYTDAEISEKLDEARKSLEDLDRGTWGTHLRKVSVLVSRIWVLIFIFNGRNLQ